MGIAGAAGRLKVNYKRMYRLYRNEGLSLRHKRPQRNNAAHLRQPKRLVQGINEIWSMDFVSDTLYDGCRLRALTAVDITLGSALQSTSGKASRVKMG